MLRPCLEEVRFTTRADHVLLKWILTVADATDRLARWQIRLFELEFYVVHRAGVEHRGVYALFYLRTTGEDQAPIFDDVPVAVLKTAPENNPKVSFVTDMATLSDEAEIRATVQIAENNDAEKESTVPPLRTCKQQQAMDVFCKQMAENVDWANAEYTVYKNGLIVQIVFIDGVFEVLLPQPPWNRLLYHSHYPVMAGHPGQQLMYDSMRRKFHWPHMANDVYTTATNCSACAQNRVEPKLRRHLQQFISNTLLELIAIDILGLLPYTVDGSQYVIVITDRYSALTRATPTGKTPSAHVAIVFVGS